MSSSQYFRYRGLSLSRQFHDLASLEFAESFPVEDSDVFVVTFPKSGTVWMQEIIPLVLNGGDLTPIHTIPNWDRVPWFGGTRLPSIVDQLTPPRAMVTHLPFHLMPLSFLTSKAKVIYVMRDPRDVLVSTYYYHQMAAFHDDPGTFDQFIDKFLEGRVSFGKWTDHIKSWRQMKLKDRIIYITYEKMKQDLPGCLRTISQFLGKNLSDQVIDKITESCSFQNMKDNKMSNFSLVSKDYMDLDKSPFLRKGIIGDWKNHFKPDQLARVCSVIRKELEGQNMDLPWSLD